MQTRIKESDLYLPILNWLELNDWEVYGEVTGNLGRADLVGIHKNGSGICVIEIKKTLNDKVIEQAIRWVGTANYIYIAVLTPKKRDLNISRVKMEILNKYGIGILTINLDEFNYKMGMYADEYAYKEDTYYSLNKDILNSGYSIYFGNTYYGVSIEKRAKFLKVRHKNYWNSKVHPLMKNVLGGSESKDGYITEYKVTIMIIKKYLFDKYLYDKRNFVDDKMCGMATVSMICNNCETHYAQPKSGVMNALTNFELDLVDRYSINSRIHFRLKDNVIKELIENSNLKMF